jgi:Ca-activated chloride channel homolog
MKPYIIISILTVFIMTNSFGQNERKMVREGVKDYQNEKFTQAEVQFRKALDEKPGLYEAEYNIANSLYKQKKYEEAAKEYDKLLQKSDDPKKRADLYHNLGNSQLMAQQYEKGIEAYKNSLRIRPEDEDTRYNLAYALQKVKEQQQQQKDDKNKDKQDQNKDQNKKDQQDKQDKQDQKDKKDQDQQQNNPQDKKEDQNKQQQNNPDQRMSEKEAEQMLNAVQNQEKEVKEKADKKKAVARPLRSEKDW